MIRNYQLLAKAFSNNTVGTTGSSSSNNPNGSYNDDLQDDDLVQAQALCPNGKLSSLRRRQRSVIAPMAIVVMIMMMMMIIHPVRSTLIRSLSSKSLTSPEQRNDEQASYRNELFLLTTSSSVSLRDLQEATTNETITLMNTTTIAIDGMNVTTNVSIGTTNSTDEFGPCYICGGDPNATILNPDVEISDLSFVSNTTCGTLYDLAKEGVFETELCVDLQNETALQEQCGCSNYNNATETPTAAPVALSDRPSVAYIITEQSDYPSVSPSSAPHPKPKPKPKPKPVSKPSSIFTPTNPIPIPRQKPVSKPVEDEDDVSNAPSVESTSWDVCYICGSEQYKITKPGTIINLSLLGITGMMGDTTCQDLATAGLSENLPSSACKKLLENTDQIQILCGCSSV